MFCCIPAVLLCENEAAGATYYVDDANGNDADTGDINHPWETLARAYDMNTKGPTANSGDTIIFYNGNYGTYFWDARTTGYFPKNNTDWVTYKAAKGHTPELNNISIYNTRNGYANGNSYVCFDGWKIDNGVSVQHDNHLRILNCTITRIPDYNASGVYAPYYLSATYDIFTREVNDVTIKGNDISNATKGLNLICSANKITRDYNVSDNVIHRTGGDGISIGASDINVLNNYIYDENVMWSEIIITGDKSAAFKVGETITQAVTGAIGRVTSNPLSSKIGCFNLSGNRFLAVAKGGGLITGSSSGQTITPTTVDGEHADGIECQCGLNSVTISNLNVERNKIICADNYWLVNGGIKFGSAAPKWVSNVICRNNVVKGWLVLLSSLEGNITFANNTFDINLLVYHTSNDTNFYPDIFANNIVKQLTFQKDAHGGKTHFLNHGNNIFGNNPNGGGGPAYPFDVNLKTETILVNINTLFVNATNNDFNLASSTLAINFGNTAYQPATDIMNYTRDVSHHMQVHTNTRVVRFRRVTLVCR